MYKLYTFVIMSWRKDTKVAKATSPARVQGEWGKRTIPLLKAMTTQPQQQSAQWQQLSANEKATDVSIQWLQDLDNLLCIQIQKKKMVTLEDLKSGHQATVLAIHNILSRFCQLKN